VYVIIPSRGDIRDPLPIALQAAGGKKEKYELVARADARVEAFGAWVPEGEYELIPARGYDMPSAKSGDDAGYPPFQVAAGRVTDLGSLVGIPVGERQIVMLPLRPTEYAGRVKDAIQEFRAYLSSEEPLEWSSDHLPRSMVPPTRTSPLLGGVVVYLIERYVERAEQAPRATGLRNATEIEDFLAVAKRTTPPLAKEGVSDSAGALYFGADLGEIRVRSPDGAWSALDTGTIRPIRAVAWDDGTLYSGSEDGVLRKSSDRGIHWTQVASVAPGERITAIAHAGERWLVAATNKSVSHYARAADRLKIYVTGPDMGELQLAKDTPMQAWAIVAEMPHAEIGNGAYYINAFPRLLRLDLKTLQWSDSSPSGDILRFSVADATGVIAAYMPRGVFTKVFVSSDGGQSWQQRPATPIELRDVYFDTNDTGTAVVARVFGGGRVWEVMRYDSQKGQWQKFQEWPRDCVQLLHDRGRKQFFCVKRGGAILSMTENHLRTEFSAD
jgi:hypothetical protein